MNRGTQDGTKLVNISADYMQMLLIINNVGIKINVGVNFKN